MVADQIKLWKARREFSLLIKTHEGEKCPILPWLELLRENGSHLAQEKIHCPIVPFTRQSLVHPFVFLLLAGADTESIREVHRLYPEVLSQPIKDDNGVIGLPLHFACSAQSNTKVISEKVLLFLIEAYPQAVVMKNSAGALPLHELLKNPKRQASLTEVTALLDTFEQQQKQQPQEPVSFCNTILEVAKRHDKTELGIPLSLAIRNANTERNVLALLTSRFPKDCNTLYLGKLAGNAPSAAAADNLFIMNHMHVSLICNKILPQLTTFHCAAKHWYPRAVPDLMKGLCVQQSLVNLTLRLPNPVTESGDIDDDYSTCHHLQQLVEQNNTSLQYLKIDFGADYSGDSIQDRNMGAAGGVEVALRFLLKGLRRNNTLKECHFGGVWMKPKDPDFFMNHFWPTLATILREQNTMLETITVKFFQRNCFGLAKDMQEVQHWTSLNPYGRALVRDSTIPFTKTVSLLAALNAAPDLIDDDNNDHKGVVVSDTTTTITTTTKMTVLYGLLRENPSLWCDKIQNEDDANRRAAEHAMVVMV